MHESPGLGAGPLRRCELFARHLPIGCFETDAAGQCECVNARWEELTGLAAAEAFGDGWVRAFHPDDREAALAVWRETIAARGTLRGTYRFQHTGGSDRWVDIHCVPVPNASAVRGFLATVEDVTERRAAEAMVEAQAGQLRAQAVELERARDDALAALRARSQFVANMSHELRTPLHAILGMTALALEGDLDDERREYIETARESATTLIALMDDVLDISRIEAERIDLSPREIDIGVLAGETLKSLAPRAHERGLELVLREATVLPRRVLGDAVRIRQVLTNLVSNAIKFTDRGEVVVSISHAVSPTGIDLHLEVADTGIGIPPEEQEQIFEPFVQVDGSTARRHGGIGLGLTIASRLARLMSGRLWVESTVGTGSTFRASLPLGVPAPREAPSSPLPPRRLLLVDDHPTAREAFCAHAALLGLEAAAAATGANALAEMRAAAARHRPFDVVFVDYNLGGEDAPALARLMDDDGRLRHVPRVLVTTAGYRAHTTARERAGFARSVLKPLDPGDLRGIVERLDEPALGGGERRALRVSAMQAPMWHPSRSLPHAEARDERGVATLQVSTFDPQALWRALSNDAELVATRLAVFLVRWQRLVRRVHVAIDALDLEAIEQYAHAMRSSLQTMAASALSATASDLEAAALEGDVERVRQVATRLDAEAPLLVRDVRFVIDHIVE